MVLALCILSAFGNAALSYVVNGLAGVPLYADTIFTIAMCFCAGLTFGILTGLLSSALFSLVYIWLRGFPVETVWTVNMFAICVILEVLLVCFFYKKIKPSETVFLKKPSLYSFTGVAAQLLVLFVLACIVVSVSGGLIDFSFNLFRVERPYCPEDTFKLGLLRNNVPLLATAIFSRIPIDIVDRFIAIFGGYGISLLYRKWIA